MSALQKGRNFLVLFIFISLFSGCGGGSDSPDPTPPPVLSSDATLSGLTVSAGDLSPSFGASTTSYTVNVANSVDSTTFTPTSTNANASISIGSSSISSGSASQSYSLAVGVANFDIVVTAEDGTTTQTYTVEVTRAGSDDATLSNITFSSSGLLEPAFDSSITDYTIVLANETESTTLTATSTHAEATLTVNGSAVGSGTASQSIALAVGDTSINVVVTAEDATTSQTYTVVVTRNEPSLVSLELIDPNPSQSSNFGRDVLILENGNIVVTDSNDSSIVPNNGAVHLYSPSSSTPIASLYGDQANDELGSKGVKELSNGNFVILTGFDDFDDGGNIISGAGSITLVNGMTGAIIGTPLRGDQANDRFGDGANAVTILENGNYVVMAREDDDLAGGILDAGSVTLVNGDTGAIIGTPVIGDDVSDQMGNNGITVLPNNNYVILTERDDDGINMDSGSAILINGSTGAMIGTPLRGVKNDERFGNRAIALNNNNYAVLSTGVDNGAILNAGSVTLVDGTTGSIIGTPIRGDSTNDNIGQSGLALDNNNFVVASGRDDADGIFDAGSIMLINGITGELIGTPLSGDNASDWLGETSLTALIGNDNFVVTSLLDDNGAVIDAGSIMLVNGNTGAIIGTPFRGDIDTDRVGNGGTVALDNGNYVVTSYFKHMGSIHDVGMVHLFNGKTGTIVGTPIEGQTAFDRIGRAGVIALGNSNFVISTSGDDNNGTLEDAGSAILVNGLNGDVISTLRGAQAFNEFASFGATALANNNFVILSPDDLDELGSVTVVDGSSGDIIGTPTAGLTESDLINSAITASKTGSHFVIGAKDWDNNGVLNSGFVKIIVEENEQQP